AYSQSSLGYVMYHTGQFGKAADSYAAALATLETILDRFPDTGNSDYPMRIAWLAGHQGAALHASGRYKQAEPAYRRAGAQLRALADRTPTPVLARTWELEEAQARVLLGGLLAEAGDPRQAEEVCKETLRDLDRLSHDPLTIDPLACKLLSASCHQLL